MTLNRQKPTTFEDSEQEDEIEKADVCKEILVIAIELMKAHTIVYPKCKNSHIMSARHLLEPKSWWFRISSKLSFQGNPQKA